ncbi:MAG TPA: sigma-70 family RNA polymerase sigma factor [Solirubrobacterales bacterium]|nr:sigma-70 family RNA polymerase sigma factor [Solirubrobacterales bacterium]
METLNPEGERPRLDPDDFATRSRAAVETFARHEAVLRRAAARYSLCAEDAEDALQRGLEILLRKAPTDDPRELVKWTQTVVKREALAIRRERERMLGRPSPGLDADEAPDLVELLPASSESPPEVVERREAVARSREALQTLKPQELRALTLLAEGYSYAEIGEITDWSQTKVNRCLAEGRERFRSMVSRGEDGRRCAELRPLLSAFCDGEAAPAEVAELRVHLRACGNCRATLRTYRAAPAAAAALLPALPLQRSLLERAHEALVKLAERFGGGRGDAASQVASGGAGGVGAAAMAKIAAVCLGAGGAAACVATGLVPGPLGEDPAQPVREVHRADAAVERTPEVTYEPAPEPTPAPKPDPDPKPQPASEEPEPAPSAAEPAPVVSEPVEAEAVESAPVPAPEPAPAPEPVAAPEAGSPAGEFGP